MAHPEAGQAVKKRKSSNGFSSTGFRWKLILVGWGAPRFPAAEMRFGHFGGTHLASRAVVKGARTKRCFK
jgi:hypothetical protein